MMARQAETLAVCFVLGSEANFHKMPAAPLACVRSSLDAPSNSAFRAFLYSLSKTGFRRQRRKVLIEMPQA